MKKKMKNVSKATVLIYIAIHYYYLFNIYILFYLFCTRLSQTKKFSLMGSKVASMGYDWWILIYEVLAVFCNHG